jgi:hypothetical protein
MLAAVKPGHTNEIAFNADTLDKGPAAAVEDKDSRFPPEWRLSYKRGAARS